MNTKPYDFIIAGGGAAGLSLACHLIHSPLRDRSILIVDKDAKDRNDRTWCFWTDQPSLFDDIVHRTWNQLQFVGESFEETVDLHSYRYKMIRGIDFYRFARDELSARANVDFLQGTVDRIDDGDDRAGVAVNGQTYTGRWAFDSRFRLSQIKPDPVRYHYLQQHFKGWEIETPAPVFSPRAATFMDFRTPQKGEMRFFYHASARTDPAAAPAGEDTLMVLIPVGHLNDSAGQDWDALQARARLAVLRRLAGVGVTDLEKHLKFEVSYTPRDWLNMYNMAKGAAFGLGHDFFQVGYLRPQNRHRRYRNLYFAGGSTHPGTGLPLVLLSACLTTERILKEISIPRPVLIANAAVVA